MDQRLEMTVIGKVQGVGFRFFVLDTATKLHLTGYVKNNPDSTVDIVAEGRKNKLIELINLIKTQDNFIRVDDVKQSFLPATNKFEDFQIR